MPSNEATAIDATEEETMKLSAMTDEELIDTLCANLAELLQLLEGASAKGGATRRRSMATTGLRRIGNDMRYATTSQQQSLRK
jgi:hypothetical protein